MNPIDLIHFQDELASFKLEFNLWPHTWNMIQDINSLQWSTIAFGENFVNMIPETPGVYSFVINPYVANHPHRYLCYIGKTDRTLRIRYRDYLRESRNSRGRPHIIRLLNKWQGYLLFCYAQVENGDVDILEKRLIQAFIPPFNPQVGGEIGKIVGAF